VALYAHLLLRAVLLTAGSAAISRYLMAARSTAQQQTHSSGVWRPDGTDRRTGVDKGAQGAQAPPIAGQKIKKNF